MIPLIKYFCKKGYTSMIGKEATMTDAIFTLSCGTTFPPPPP